MMQTRVEAVGRLGENGLRDKEIDPENFPVYRKCLSYRATSRDGCGGPTCCLTARLGMGRKHRVSSQLKTDKLYFPPDGPGFPHFHKNPIPARFPDVGLMFNQPTTRNGKITAFHKFVHRDFSIQSTRHRVLSIKQDILLAPCSFLNTQLGPNAHPVCLCIFLVSSVYSH